MYAIYFSLKCSVFSERNYLDNVNKNKKEEMFKVSWNSANKVCLINCIKYQPSLPVLRIRSIFPRIRIRGSDLKNTEPDPTYYLDMFLMFSKINIFYGIFSPNLNIIWHLESKIKNYYAT